jgi:hypothetical protein
LRKRPRNTKAERAGLLAVENACNRLDLIWRDLLQEDVGVDGTIEIALGEFPTGKLVGAQVKSGVSYIRSETESSFKFYPDPDDLAYWTELSIPLFLLVHNPADGLVYWTDISRHVQERAGDPLDTPYIKFLKTNKMDEAFASYLRGRFDLTVYDEVGYDEVRAELESIIHSDGDGESAVSISALTLFIEGLWGLCSKLQFHSSLLSDLIRKTVRERTTDINVRYTFDRATLYPYFTRYFDTLTKHHLAVLDVADINHSLYAKLEFPAFIASLTTNGRRFVEYLREREVPRVSDNQYLTLSMSPHVQIEVYLDFQLIDGLPHFGPYTDVLAISFNAHLDYYHLLHLNRPLPEQSPTQIASQTIFYHELREYIAHRFDNVPKNNLLFRYQDIPLSPLICWLEHWNENPQVMPTELLRGKTNLEQAGLSDEFLAIISPAGVATVKEPLMPPFPLPILKNGERLPHRQS